MPALGVSGSETGKLAGNSFGQLPAEPRLRLRPSLPFFKAGSCYIAQTGLEFANLQPQSPECWHYRPMPPHPDSTLHFGGRGWGVDRKTGSQCHLQECGLVQ